MRIYDVPVVGQYKLDLDIESFCSPHDMIKTLKSIWTIVDSGLSF